MCVWGVIAMTSTAVQAPLLKLSRFLASAYDSWPQSAMVTGLLVLPDPEPTASIACTTSMPCVRVRGKTRVSTHVRRREGHWSAATRWEGEGIARAPSSHGSVPPRSACL